VAIDYIQILSTYSIVALDSTTGQMGVAVQTHQVSLGRMVPFLLPGIGAIATQSLVNVGYGSMGLAMLREGVSAPDVVKGLVASDNGHNYRQVAVVDAQGMVGAYTGDNCIPHAGHHLGEGYSVQANMMANDSVLSAMTNAYENSSEDLAGRMMAALYAAQEHDDDIHGMRSAALLIVENDINVPTWDSIYDLRVDEAAQPLDKLQRLVIFQRAQHISTRGHDLLNQGNADAALRQWKKARELAPDNKEMAFWQAIALADKKPITNAVSVAARIMQQAVENDDRYSQWVDLIYRLEQVGIIERKGTGRELLVELGEA
jgi:uncharacterized Ntn-hydrolase superfamily protein